MDKIDDSFSCANNATPKFQDKTFNTFYVLLATVCLTILVLIGKFHWNRRKIYRAAAKVKGPPTLPIIGNALLFMGDMTKVFENIEMIAMDYADVLSRVWLGTKLLFIINKPEHMEIVLQSPHCVGKDALYEYTRVVVGTGLFAAPVPKWKKHRKLISPAFNQKILDSFMDIFNDQTRIFLKNLESNVGKKDIDILNFLSRMALDSLCESAMGVKVGSQTNKYSKLNESIDLVMKVTFIRIADLWYHFDFIFNMSKMAKTFKEAVSQIHDFTNKVVKEKSKQFKEKMEKLKNGEEIDEEELHEKKTFLNLLLQLTYEGSKMTDEELRQEVTTFTIAGSDTSATNVSFCFTMLGMHPELQEKLREEVLDVLGEDRDITPEDMPRLVLLERFIKETLRIFPVAPIVIRTTDKDVDLGDHQIPAGCSMVLAVIGVQRNPRVWKDPLKFDPDRFLPEEVAKRHPYSYVPFLNGPRNCIGYKYAMMSIKTTLAMVLRKFVVKTEYKTIEEIKLRINIVLKPADGYKVSVHLRE